MTTLAEIFAGDPSVETDDEWTPTEEEAADIDDLLAGKPPVARFAGDDSQVVVTIDAKTAQVVNVRPYAAPRRPCMWAHQRRPQRTSRARRPRVMGKRAAARAPGDDDPSDPEPPPLAPQPLSRDQREQVEAGHTRPMHLRWAFHDFRETVDALAGPYDDAWECRKCLRATLATIVIYAGLDRLRELLGDGEA